MEELREYYSKRFRSIEKERADKPRSTALEMKFCLTDEQGRNAASSKISGLWNHLVSEGWELLQDRYAQSPVGVSRTVKGMEERIGLATGESQIEFALVPHYNLHDCWDHVLQIKKTLEKYTERNGLFLLCLGIQPVTPPQDKVRQSARHQFWSRIGGTDQMYLLGCIADSQVHVDITMDEAVTAINVFQALSGAQIALTANATLWCGEIDWSCKDLKELFWKRWLPDNHNGRRIGVFGRSFTSLDDYVDTVCAFQPVFVVRDGESIGIYEYETFRDYFHAPNAVGKTPSGETIELRPSFADIDLHDSFYWWNARISRFFTLENRANAQQPPDEIMAIPALTLGIMENLPGVAAMLAQSAYTRKQLVESRQGAYMHGLEATVGGKPIIDLCSAMVTEADEALIRRGLGEEMYLAPLKERLIKKQSPADSLREDFSEGGIERVVEKHTFA